MNPLPDLPRPALLDGSFQVHLLHDRARLDAYAEAIRETVKPGDVVADVGSGSGVLAYLAVKAGAAKVHAVELNTYSYKTLLNAVREHDLTGRVIPVLGDGEKWTPPEPVDVLLSELMETGLLHEPIVSVCRNVHENWKRPPRAFLPRGADLLVEAVELADDFHGYRVTPPGFRATANGEPLSDLHAYARIDFTQPGPPTGVDARFTLTGNRAGTAHALRLRTVTHLTDRLTHDESPAYCSPVILPLDAPLEVEAGMWLAGRIAYAFDYDEKPLRYELAPA